MSRTERTQINPNFRILETLGQGGMGEIYKAHDTRLDRIVAVKVLLADQFANEEAHLRFEREARAGAQLEHDNIVTTYDFGIHDGRPFLVMGFIEGETLHQRLQREGVLSVEDTIRMIAPIARALAYAHGKSVIHRDITSRNIMIRAEDDRPMLIDFGIAQAAYDQRLTSPGESLGTITYMSPEQAKAQEVDYRSDLYSLGVVLYECLTGTLPFQSSNSLVLLSNIRFEPHPPLLDRRPDLPPWIAKVVDRCLAKDPADRFQHGNALADALEQAQPLGKKKPPTAPSAAVPPSLPPSPPAVPAIPPNDQGQPSRATPVSQETVASKIPDGSSAPDRAPLSAQEVKPEQAKSPRRYLWGMGLLVTTIVAVGGGTYSYQSGLFDSFLPTFSFFQTQTADSLATTDSTSFENDDPPVYGDTTGLLPMVVLSPDSSLTDSLADLPVATADTPTDQPEAQTDPVPPTPTRPDPPVTTPSDPKPIPQDQTASEPQPPTPAQRAAEGVAAYRAGKYKVALPILEETARQGVAEAQFLLGEMYAQGRAVGKSESTAEDWYLKAAQQGHTLAQYTLARHFRDKGRSDKALPWYVAAARAGNAEAQYQAGFTYMKQNKEPEALEWWRKAAAQGHEKARKAMARIDNRKQRP